MFFELITITFDGLIFKWSVQFRGAFIRVDRIDGIFIRKIKQQEKQGMDLERVKRKVFQINNLPKSVNPAV